MIPNITYGYISHNKNIYILEFQNVNRILTFIYHAYKYTYSVYIIYMHVYM